MSGSQGFAGLRVASFESRMAEAMRRLIASHGGVPLIAPALQEVPLADNPDALMFGEKLLAGTVDLLILTTGVGTTALVDVLTTRHPLPAVTAALGRLALVARGPKPVAALKALGLTAALTVPEPNTWRDVIATLDAHRPVAGLRVAVQEYGVSNGDLLDALRQRGATVTPVPIYRWALPADLSALRSLLTDMLAGQVDVVLLTNAAQADHVMRLLEQEGRVELFRQRLARMLVGSIGPTASERLRHHGWPVDLEPSHPKMGLLVKETAERAQELLERKRGARTNP